MRLRRLSKRSRGGSSGGGAHPPDSRLAELQRRLEHLEIAFEGLQDSVHRDAMRQNRLLEELRRDMQPEAISRALSESARRRGI
jgi:hypothetical protein